MDKSIREIVESLKKDFEKGLDDNLNYVSDGVDSTRIITIISKIKEILDESFIEVMDELDPYFKFSSYFNMVVKIVSNMLISGENLDYTGMVIAGYGSDEYTPSYYEYAVSGLFYDGLNYSETRKVKIDYETRSKINTFAQDDVVQTYLYGIDEELSIKINNTIKNMLYRSTDEVVKLTGATDYTDHLRTLNDGLAEKFEEDLWNYTYNNYMEPTESAVEFLSKDEMVLMAESMINFTSLKRRVSDKEETVGGPVDVAVISRNEGLVWVKRKQYFNMELNPHYKGCKNVS
jgi:hypothetical protein